jgi:enoyl-CoA hydratase/carnithine racemase
MSTDRLRTIHHDAVTELRLDRPAKLNAVDDEMLVALHDRLADVSSDPTTALLLSGEGRVTCAGRDLAAVSDPEYERHERQSALMDLLRSYPLPTAMAGKGAVVGFGFALQLDCDFLVVGEETALSLPEVEFDVDVSDRIEPLADVVGRRIAVAMVCSGAAIDGPRAYDLGLANDVVPESQVDERARAFLTATMETDSRLLRSILETGRATRPERRGDRA